MREEVWQAGQTRRSLQAALPARLALMLAGGSALFGILTALVMGEVVAGIVLTVGLTALGVVPVLVAALVCRSVGVIYTMIALRRLRRQMRSVPPDARRATLAIFCTEGDEARELAEALLRELHLPTEITPSAAPSSRGDEPTPAE